MTTTRNHCVPQLQIEVGLAPDEQLANDICRTVAAADIDVIPAIGALAVAAVLIIQSAYSKDELTDGEVEA